MSLRLRSRLGFWLPTDTIEVVMEISGPSAVANSEFLNSLGLNWNRMDNIWSYKNKNRRKAVNIGAALIKRTKKIKIIFELEEGD